MTIRFSNNDKGNPPGKLADAELYFDDGPLRERAWRGNAWQDFLHHPGLTVLFQVKAFQNGNLHLRFKPEAIRALNIEAGRLLGWLRGPGDIVSELGYSREDAERYFGANQQLGAGSVRLLQSGTPGS